MSSDSGLSPPIGGHITASSESLKVTPPTKHAGDKTRLSNGHSEAHIGSSVDESPPLNNDSVLEVESTSNGVGDSSPNDSPLSKEKTLSPNDSPLSKENTSRQASHEREDSSSSLVASGGETETLEPSSSSSSSSSRLLGGESDATLTSSYSLNQASGLSLDTSRSDNDARGDNEQPLSSEVAVAHSPDGRFLKYDIEIGRGSFKTVYKGLDTETGVAIAWCELKEKRYSKAEQARFKEEVSILKTLQHPNILKLYDSWESANNKTAERKDKLKDRVLVLITELMTSGTLKSYMRRLKSIKPKVIRSWGRQILKGLHFLHTRMPPIIHRDLKCDNIFINGTTGLVKIGDLGLATLKRNDVSTVIGTPEFMAPEMYEESYDESVDVYAFGMCLLEMCTQEYPYMECSNPAQIYKKVSQGIKPHAIDKVKDASLRDIIDKCTTVDKVQRFDVLDLLNHEYFSENIKIEMVPGSEPVDIHVQSTEPTSLLTMRMDVPKQDANKKNGQESIEFPYDLTKDVPEDVVREMVKSRVLALSVQQMVVRSLREYVEGVKQKLQGRSKTDNTNADGKLAEPKPDLFSQTPSPSPGTTNETSPTDSDASPAPVQRQASGQASGQSEMVKPEEQVVPKELLQGLDITGQGTIPTLAYKERSMSINMSKGSETKTGDLLSPVSQHASEQNLSTGQQITASTGQSVPQMNSMKVLSARSQSTSTVMESKSYSLAVKEGSSTERHTGGLSIEATQETGYLSANSLQELSIPGPPDTSNDDSGVSMSSGGTGTLKKKGQRQKGKGIKLTLIEHLSETKKLVCQLTSNSKLLKYQFSIKYDKPEEMFKKFVTGGYLTEQDKDEFILQSNQLIQSVKKGKDLKIEMTETKLGIQEQGKSRASAEPLISPPTETAESVSKLSIEQTSQSEPRSSKNGSPKLEPSKQSQGSQVPTTEAQQIAPTMDRMVTPEPLKEIPHPLSVPNSSTNGGASSQRGQQPQGGDNVSTLVTIQEMPRPRSPGSKSQPQQLLPNPLITGAQMYNLSSCSLPSLVTQFPATLPVCHPSTQFSINSTVPPTAVPTSRVFEVETVAEDHPDSPDSDELSAPGSTENLGRETPRSISQDSSGQAVVGKRFIVQSVPSLESKSDSYIGKEPSPSEPSTNTMNQYPPNQISANVQQSNLSPEDTKPAKNNSAPTYVLPLRVTRHSQRPSQTSSIPEHYCTTPIPNTWPRGGITDETYVPPAYRRYPSSNTLPSHPSSDSEGLEQEIPAYAVDRPPMNIDELPQASLLSEAFMRFMHSMSTVFRDPTFQPLISSLDQRFNPSSATYNRVQQDPADGRHSSQSVPARSQQEVLNRRVNYHVAGEAESLLHTRSNVSRSVTEPGGAIPDSSCDVELRTALEEIEEEQRKLERRRQQVIQNFRRKHSSGNSSLESSSGIDTRKISTASYESYAIPSPTPVRRIPTKMNEYEEAGGSDSSSSTIGTTHKPSNNSMAQLEKRVRDELMSDKLGFDTALPANFDSSPSRSRTPQNQPLTRIGSSLGQPDRGGSISPVLQTSPPPSQTAEQATFQMHTSPGAPIVHKAIAKIPHSDSGEWTDYTSAPVVQQAGYSDNGPNYSSTSTRGLPSTARTSSSQTLSTVSSSKADVSEFDPITSSTNTGPKS